jgi:hypothetical protein
MSSSSNHTLCSRNSESFIFSVAVVTVILNAGSRTLFFACPKKSNQKKTPQCRVAPVRQRL